jgi:hypothetical protein
VSLIVKEIFWITEKKTYLLEDVCEGSLWSSLIPVRQLSLPRWWLERCWQCNIAQCHRRYNMTDLQYIAKINNENQLRVIDICFHLKHNFTHVSPWMLTGCHGNATSHALNSTSPRTQNVSSSRLLQTVIVLCLATHVRGMWNVKVRVKIRILKGHSMK